MVSAHHHGSRREARGVVAPGGPTSGPWRPLRDCCPSRCRLPPAAAAAAAASPHRLWGESASGPVGGFLCLAWTSLTSPGPRRPLLPLSPPSRARSWQVLRECLNPALPFPTPPPLSGCRPRGWAVAARRLGHTLSALPSFRCVAATTGGLPRLAVRPACRPRVVLRSAQALVRWCRGLCGPAPGPLLPSARCGRFGKRAAGRGGDRVGSVDGGHSVQNRLARVW